MDSGVLRSRRRFGLGRNQRQRWRQSRDGRHGLRAFGARGLALRVQCDVDVATRTHRAGVAERVAAAGSASAAAEHAHHRTHARHVRHARHRDRCNVHPQLRDGGLDDLRRGLGLGIRR